MKKQISYKVVSLVFSVLVICFAIAFYAFSWTGPTAPPPGGNVDPPINIGGTSQYKSGALGIGGVFRAYSNAIIDGNVGIGTTSPDQKLDVAGNVDLTGDMRFMGSTNKWIFHTPDDGRTTLYIAPDTGAGWDWSKQIRFENNGSIFASGTICDSVGCIGAGAGLWEASGNDIYNSNSGNVGIGTTGPARKLHIEGGGQVSLLQSGTVATNSQAGLYWHTVNDYAIYRTPGAWTASTYQQLKLDWPTGIILDPGTGNNAGYDKSYVEITGGKGLRVTQGNVGIGTTSPGQKLVVNDGRAQIIKNAHSAGANDYYLELYSPNTGSASNEISLRFHQGSQYWGQIRYRTGGFRFTQGHDDNLTKINVGDLYAAGNVGIGTTSPQAKLDVRGAITTSGSNIELTQQSSGNRYSYIDFHGDDTYTDYGLRLLRGTGGANTFSQLVHRGTGDLQITTVEAGAIKLKTSSADRLTITSGGNVGIGTTSPSQKLDVSGQIHATGDICTDQGGGVCLSTAGGYYVPSDVKATTSGHNGNFGGYKQMNDWIQTNGCAGYHVCDNIEVVRYVSQTGVNPPTGWLIGMRRDAWWIFNIAGAFAFYLEPDCCGWKKGAGSGAACDPNRDLGSGSSGNIFYYYAQAWSNIATDISTRSCANSIPVLCCK